jgi:hypothetical protein
MIRNGAKIQGALQLRCQCGFEYCLQRLIQALKIRRGPFYCPKCHKLLGTVN